MQTSVETKLAVKKNDQVQVIAGREKGKVGKVLSVSTKSGRVTVEKVNMVKRHVKASQQNPQGGIVEKELPLHYSNVLLYCTKCARGVRHGSKMEAKKGSKKQTKIRVCKRCGEGLDKTA